MANIDFHAKKKRNCSIPKFELESLARCLLPDIQAFLKAKQDGGSLKRGKHSRNDRSNKERRQYHHDTAALPLCQNLLVFYIDPETKNSLLKVIRKINLI